MVVEKLLYFEAIRRLQRFLTDGVTVEDTFPPSDVTRWLNSPIQTFQLNFILAGQEYGYELRVEHDMHRRLSRVSYEELKCDGRPLFLFSEGTATLFRDDFSTGPQLIFDWSRSGVGAVQPRPENSRLIQFRQALDKLVIVRLNPFAMDAESRKEDMKLGARAENFVSWYRYASSEFGMGTDAFKTELRQSIDNFESLSLVTVGTEAKVLKAHFHRSRDTRDLCDFTFAELSEGQKVMVVLYFLLFGLKGQHYSLFIDEPDNFLALREIQPWIVALTDLIGDGLEQAVLISHHPEIINYLGGSKGRWFFRAESGHARVTDVPPDTGGLSLSETLARGWDK